MVFYFPKKRVTYNWSAQTLHPSFCLVLPLHNEANQAMDWTWIKERSVCCVGLAMHAPNLWAVSPWARLPLCVTKLYDTRYAAEGPGTLRQAISVFHWHTARELEPASSNSWCTTPPRVGKTSQFGRFSLGLYFCTKLKIKIWFVVNWVGSDQYIDHGISCGRMVTSGHIGKIVSNDFENHFDLGIN
jgi:hypothetical protein